MSTFESIAFALLDNYIRNYFSELSSVLFESKELRELRAIVKKSLEEALKRLIEEYPDREISQLLLELPLWEMPSIGEAAKRFYERPTDTTLARVLVEHLIDESGHRFSTGRIEVAVSAFILFFLEDLTIRSPQVRERLNALMTLNLLANPPQPTFQGDHIMGNKFDISNSPIGILNTGEISNVEKISVHVSTVKNSGNAEIADALSTLTEAVKANNEVAQAQRAELLEQIEELSKQASLPSDKRSSTGVIKAVISSIASGLGTAANLAQIWSVWGEPIKKFFGLA
jgi:hypothetical protein